MNVIIKNFRINIILRVLLICASIYGFFYLILNTALYATIFIVGLLAFYQIYGLVRYVERTNRNLSRFLQAIRHSDFSQSFTGSGLGSAFEELNNAFAEVIREFQTERSKSEEHFRYLQTVVQHVGIGLIAFEPTGEVELMNTAVKRLLKINQLKNITSLGMISEDLVSKLFLLAPGEKDMVKLQDGDELIQLIIYATEFKLREKSIKLVSLQNIQSELEEKEMEAWQKLIRVLTHEIMNSITPIASLASTVNDLLEEDGAEEVPHEILNDTIGDVRNAIHTIQKRSEGLLRFVNSYRSLTRLPKPNFQIFPVTDLFERVSQLMAAQVNGKSIDFQVEIEPQSLELTADPDMVEQVLINLLKNSVEALEGKPAGHIDLTARLDERGRVIIQVTDNGQGITREALEKLFIPFFTTKKEGSGIGLSLSRQIMRLHRGTISVTSTPGLKTTFKLTF